MSKGSIEFTDRALSREAFAERLRMLTSARGAIPELSRAIGVTTPAIRKWASGETEPSRDFLVAAAESLGVSVEWLATGRGDPRINSQPIEDNGDIPSRWILDALEGLEIWLKKNGKSINDPSAKRELVATLAQEAWDKERAANAGSTPAEASDIIDLTQHERFLKIIAR